MGFVVTSLLESNAIQHLSYNPHGVLEHLLLQSDVFFCWDESAHATYQPNLFLLQSAGFIVNPLLEPISIFDRLWALLLIVDRLRALLSILHVVG